MEPSVELQRAALDALKAYTPLTDIVGQKIYDRVPEKKQGNQNVPDVTSPYISCGPVTSIPDDADCIDGEEITFQLDAWSWGGGEAYGSVEVRKIAGLIKKALHRADLTLSTNALVSIRHEMTRILRESDGVTNRAVLQFTAIVETP